MEARTSLVKALQVPGTRTEGLSKEVVIKKRESLREHLEGRSSKTSSWPEGGATEHPCENLEETAASAPKREAGRQEDEGRVWTLVCRGQVASGRCV